MNGGFFLKLVIAILAGFGLLLAGFHLFEPIRFKIRENRLLSDDHATSENAAKSIAETGKNAYTHIARWLDSDSEKYITAACLVLKNMEGDGWMEFIPQLELILSRPFDKSTVAVVDLLTDGKKYLRTKEKSINIAWKQWEDKTVVKRNICIALLQNEDEDWRNSAAFELENLPGRTVVAPLIAALEKDTSKLVRDKAAIALGNTGNKAAVIPLIRALKNDKEGSVRSRSALALFEIGDRRALSPLIEALKNDPDSSVRGAAAGAIYFMPDVSAIEPLLNALNDSDEYVRAQAAFTLGIIGGDSAVMPLIKALRNDFSFEVRFYCANALGRIGDNRAVAPLIAAFEQDVHDWVRNWSMYALGCFPDENIDAALNRAKLGGNVLANYVIAWRTGEIISEMDNSINDGLLVLAKARWGDATALDELLNKLPGLMYVFQQYYPVILSLLPEGAPKLDLKTDYSIRKNQAAVFKEWYEKNKSRLAWDTEKRKYYLKSCDSGNR
jgi:HEAT repeat protein